MLWWLVQNAWTDAVDEPALSLSDGLLFVAVFGGLATVAIVGGAVAYAKGRPPAATVAAVVLGVGGLIVGFVGGLLTALARVETSEH